MSHLYIHIYIYIYIYYIIYMNIHVNIFYVLYVWVFIYIYIYIIYTVSSHNICKQKRLFWMQISAMNHLTALILLYVDYNKIIFSKILIFLLYQDSYHPDNKCFMPPQKLF